ncbi:MAG: type II methionyl aminopeptidase [Candidatus Woesearchaeota archaeon]
MELVTPENVGEWRKAGKIAAEALQHGAGLVKKGALLRDVCEAVEQKIIELGAKPAWPVQVSCNEVAAHFTPDHDDNTACDDKLVCLDVGAHINGCIGDCALTVDLSGKYSDLVKTAKEAYEAAKKVVAVGATLGDIGRAIQETITSAGFAPVRNLSGHTLSPFVIHDQPSIPNVDTGSKTELVKGQIIAIEPFTTTGAGVVEEAERANIFSLLNKKPVRSPYARDALKFIDEAYANLPFTTRWLAKTFGPGRANLAIRELNLAGCLHSYPPLVEKNKGMVAVHENTLLVDDKVEELTRG